MEAEEKTIKSLRHCLKLWDSRGRSWGVRGLQVWPDKKKTILEMLCSRPSMPGQPLNNCHG